MNHQRIIYYPVFPESHEPGSERSDFVRHWVQDVLIPEGRATQGIKGKLGLIHKSLLPQFAACGQNSRISKK